MRSAPPYPAQTGLGRQSPGPSVLDDKDEHFQNFSFCSFKHQFCLKKVSFVQYLLWLSLLRARKRYSNAHSGYPLEPTAR
jgi:hypothetical protein